MATRELYCVLEKKRGGVRRRRCHGSLGTKAEAERFAKGMRKNFGDRFTYRVVKAKLAYIDVPGIKIRSSRRQIPAQAIVGHRFSFGTLYYYGADNYFLPKKGYIVKAGR